MEPRDDADARSDYEAPTAARVPLDEGTVFTAPVVASSMGMECK